MVEEYVNYTNREKQYKARAILVVPYMVKEIPSIDKITKTGCWILADADEDDIQQKKVGYLSHAKINSDSDNASETDIFICKLAQPRSALMNSCNEYKISIGKQNKNREERFVSFRFSWGETFWGTQPNLIIVPLTHLALITIPLCLEDPKMDTGDSYEFFNHISDVSGYNNSQPTLIESDNNKQTLIELLDEILAPIGDKTPLYTKSFISYICAYNQDVRSEDTTDELVRSACKLAWTKKDVGFTIDNDLTSTKLLLDTPNYGRVSAACGTYGVAIVADSARYSFRNRTDQYFWVFIGLLMLRFSLLNMLNDISTAISKVRKLDKDIVKKDLLNSLRESYQRISLLKAKFVNNEISDQYEFSRMYDLSYKGLKIYSLYRNVEEKLDAIKEIIKIENDKIEEKNREESLLNEQKNHKIQIFITALLFLLTITSALNDFFDILEDSSKVIPGIVSLAAVAIVMIIFKDRLKEVFDKKSR